MRVDGRQPNGLRPLKITPNYLIQPPGSCLIEMGNTKVICSAMLEESVPPFLKGSGRGWLTAEYSMLPASSSQRVRRERSKIGGRTQEIQRLIGRSLRNCLHFEKLGERAILIDCDVMDADGGTRTAAITGGYVALALAIKKLVKEIPEFEGLLKVPVAAVSVGIVDGNTLLDLNYAEDKDAEVDMNIVMTGEHQFVEIQGTGENAPFNQQQLQELINIADQGLSQLFTAQQKAIESV